MPAIRFSPCLAFLLAACIALPASAQRGSGEGEGIARQGERPPLTRLSGTLESVEIGDCATTTGRVAIGAHAILDTQDEGPVNLHLGPAVALTALLDRLMPGESLAASAFRTARMPEGVWVAQAVRLGGGDRFVLRDETSLRPRWAIGPTLRPGPGRGEGRGDGPGRAPLDESGMATADTATVGRALDRTCWWSLPAAE
jgi:hypothetical protein